MTRRNWIIILCAVLFIAAYEVTAQKGAHPSIAKPVELLIFSPHPDDAVLCCSGIIQQLGKVGKRVMVVTVTDGEGYTGAASAWFNKPEKTLTPSDMQRFGKVRRTEDVAALTSLGILKADIRYLGYPDGVLPEVYNALQMPVKSPYTGLQETLDIPHRPFTKASLQKDIDAILTALTPKEILIPGKEDTAEDHEVVGNIVLDEIRSHHISSTLLTYAVHRATASAERRSTDLVIPLSPEELARKSDAINIYKTQMPDMEFLSTFTGPEVFHRLGK